MKISIVDLKIDLESIRYVVNKAFANTSDASLDDWFSFDEMVKTIYENRGICLKAEDGSGKTVGMIYAQQESPINGRESLEKWVIIIAAVVPEASGKGIGGQ